MRLSARTLLRGIGLALGALVVLALAGSLALRIYGDRRLATAQRALEASGVSLNLASYELPGVPAEENSALWFRAGAAAVVLGKDDRAFVLASSRLPVKDWDDERARRVRALLSLNHGAMDTLHRGATLRRSSFEIEYRNGSTAHLPDVLALRNAAGILVAEARLALREGNEDEFLLAERSVSRLADVMTAEPTDMMQIVGDSVGKQALSFVAEVVTGTKMLPATLEALRGALPTSDRLPALRRSLALEAATSFSMFEVGREFDDLLGAGHSLSILNVTGYGRVIHAAFVEAAADRQKRVDAPIESWPFWGDYRPTSRWPHRWLPDVFKPITDHLILGARLNLAAGQLVRAGIEVRAAGLRDGKYPAVAPEEPAFTEANALNGRPLRYTVAASGAARIEVPGLAVDQLWGPHGKPLLALDLPASPSFQPGLASAP